MKTMEFEGRTERDAVAQAAAELGSESFDVEILEKSGGFFGRGKVRIRVRPLDTIPDPLATGEFSEKASANKEKTGRSKSSKEGPFQPLAGSESMVEKEIKPPSKEIQKKISEFTESLIERMGFTGSVDYTMLDQTKATFEITTEFSNILIGRRGHTLDSMQQLANSYMNRIVEEEVTFRVVLDCEGYRARHEEFLLRKAHQEADGAVRTQSSRLMEPMNPFERRLVHSTLSERDDVISRSEGEGLYKRIRIISKNSSGRFRQRR